MSVAYSVLAPLVLVQDVEGKTHHVYQGGVIEELSTEQVDHLLGLGFIAKVGDAPAIVPGTEFLDEPDEEPSGDLERPSSNANKADLVEWVYTNVAKEDGSDFTTDELEELNKSELWELIDGVE